jgi:hypothetical protein
VLDLSSVSCLAQYHGEGERENPSVCLAASHAVNLDPAVDRAADDQVLASADQRRPCLARRRPVDRHEATRENLA